MRLSCSRIEGTQATLQEVLKQDAGLAQAESRVEDIEEIGNYRAALFFAEAEMEQRPISLSLIRAIHQRLLQGVRGQNKEPGRFRVDQNWIGRPGCLIEDARFVPCSPLILTSALEDWERYLSSPNDDPVPRTAIAHAQFEILHPFKDGNGRIGRMLIPLHLFQSKVLTRPMFYLSEYLEANREAYYDSLLSITETGSWQTWLNFMLPAIASQAESNYSKAAAILQLYTELKSAFVKVLGSTHSILALDAFFKTPILNAADFAYSLQHASRTTTNTILRRLTEASLIHSLFPASGKRPGVFVLHSLVNIAEGRRLF